ALLRAPWTCATRSAPDRLAFRPFRGPVVGATDGAVRPRPLRKRDRRGEHCDRPDDAEYCGDDLPPGPVRQTGMTTRDQDHRAPKPRTAYAPEPIRTRPFGGLKQRLPRCVKSQLR